MLTPLLVLVIAVLAVALFLRGSEVMYAVLSVNSTYAYLNLTDTGPGINITCYDVPTSSTSTILLVGGDKREVVCNGTADDSNGNSELSVVSGYFSTGDKKNCTQDNLNCYVNNTCGFLGSPNTTAKYYECRFWLWFNAQNTTKSGTWVGNATIYSNGAGSKNASATYVGLNVSELLAIGVRDMMRFGSHAVGANDSQVGTCAECDHPVYNYGNIRMDILVNGTDFTPGAGGSCNALKVGFLHANLTDNSDYSMSYALTLYSENSTAAMSGFNLNPNATVGVPNNQPTIPSNGTVYWGIGVPMGVAGNCQSTIWFTAVSG